MFHGVTSSHMQFLLYESTPAETMVDGLPRARSLFSIKFLPIMVSMLTPKIMKKSIFEVHIRRTELSISAFESLSDFRISMFQIKILIFSWFSWLHPWQVSHAEIS